MSDRPTISNQNHFAIGYEAIELADLKPDKTVMLRSLKRCLSCDRLPKEEKYDCQNPAVLPHCIGGKKLQIFGQEYHILFLIKRYLEEILNQALVKQYFDSPQIGRIGFSVPAMFGYEPRNTACKALLEIVGNKPITIDVLNEPTAAILACRDTVIKGTDGIYAICDIGGGTTDIAVFEKKEEDDRLFFFKPQGLQIAGDDIDRALVSTLFPKNSKVRELYQIPYIFKVIKHAKESLTVSSMEEMNVLGERLKKDHFNLIVTPILKKIVAELWHQIKAAYDAYKPYSETGREFHLRNIILSGGGAKIPLLKALIEQDENIRELAEKVETIHDDNLYQLHPVDLPIVVVAYGTSMPKDVIDIVQQKLPYSIYVEKEDIRTEIAPIYSELPVEFTITGAQSVEIRIIAEDIGNRFVPFYDLTEELYSREDKRLLRNIIHRSPRWQLKINDNNILWLHGVHNIRRSFDLPWQGCIEPALFEKFCKEWRQKRGFA